jgi:hypothetical protein
MIPAIFKYLIVPFGISKSSRIQRLAVFSDLEIKSASPAYVPSGSLANQSSHSSFPLMPHRYNILDKKHNYFNQYINVRLVCRVLQK